MTNRKFVQAAVGGPCRRRCRRQRLARGQDGWPYFMLAGLGGAAYVVALVFLRFRR